MTFSLRQVRTALSHLPRLRVESEDFPSLDALRFIASMGIVFFHWRDYLDVSAHARTTFNHFEGLVSFVDLFFAISGFIICHVYQSRVRNWPEYLRFLQKRVARLAPLHWATLAACLLIFFLAHSIAAPINNVSNYDMHCLVPIVFLIHAFGTCNHLTFNGPSWSISAEMACYFLFPLFLRLLKLRVWLPAAFASIFLVTLYAADEVTLSDSWYWRTYDWGILRAFPAFAFGMTLYGIRNYLGHIPTPHALMLAALGLLVLWGLTGLNMAWSPILAYAVVILAVGADAAKVRRTNIASGIRLIAPLGQLTYSTYMLHTVVGTVLVGFWIEHVLHLHGFVKNVAIMFAVFALIGISYISLFLFEHPARVWISNLARPSRSADRVVIMSPDESH